LPAHRPDADTPAEPDRGDRLGMFAALRIREFRRYIAGFLCAGIALNSFMVALGWLSFDLTGDASTLGAVLFTFGICMVGAALVGGVVADRYNRALVIISMQSVIAAIAVVLGVLVLTDAITLWHLYVAAALGSTTISLHQPSHMAFIYSLVGRASLANAIALSSGSYNVARLFTPAIAGVLIGVWGVETVYVLVVAGFTLSIMVVLTFVGSGADTGGERSPSLVLDLRGDGAEFDVRTRVSRPAARLCRRGAG